VILVVVGDDGEKRAEEFFLHEGVMGEDVFDETGGEAELTGVVLTFFDDVTFGGVF